MLNITFWQAVVLFLLARDFIERLTPSSTKTVEDLLIKAGFDVTLWIFSLYMAGFFHVWMWPQFVMVSVYSIAFLVLVWLALCVLKAKELTTATPNLRAALTSTFMMTTLLYFGDFFSTISFN